MSSDDFAQLPSDNEKPMSIEEIAKHFNEPVPVEKNILRDLASMTEAERQKFEEEQKYSSDIYRIAARVKNLARNGGASLTPVGEMMCNTYIHVLRDLYLFAETLDEVNKKALRELIMKHENMPANLISAAKTGVKRK